MKKRFELLEHTADTGIIAYGDTLEEAFFNTALGMFSIITKPEEVQPVETIKFRILSSDLENLLIDWLNELLYIFDVDYYIFNSVEIIHLDQTSIDTVLRGEKIDLSRHEITTEIKAVTWHMLKIEQNDPVRIQVVFDI